jgi:hypothetical protein
MSILETRGGYPHVFRETITTGGRSHRLPFIIKYLKIKAKTNPLRLYFTEDAYTADANYVEVTVADGWEGPVEIGQLWFKGVGGDSDIELVAFQRRG